MIDIIEFFGKKFECDQCKMKFSKDQRSNRSYTTVHHHITKCADCRKQFIHKGDQLYHSRK
jgi:Zn finger protein HypA/HybF involved in hydrogenase expression